MMEKIRLNSTICKTSGIFYLNLYKQQILYEKVVPFLHLLVRSATKK